MDGLTNERLNTMEGYKLLDGKRENKGTNEIEA